MEHTAAEFDRAKGRISYVHANPWIALGMAAAAGMLIGLLAAKR
jgi:ElaB/YqjD/DUF883 family membrane-anchored ribosome-binding protein